MNEYPSSKDIDAIENDEVRKDLQNSFYYQRMKLNEAVEEFKSALYEAFKPFLNWLNKKLKYKT